jgi:hypothetical protein
MGRRRGIARAVALVAVLVALAVTTAVATTDGSRPSPSSEVAAPVTTRVVPASPAPTTVPVTTTAAPATTAPPLGSGFLTGVVEPTKGGTLPTVDAFATAMGRPPEIVAVFTSFAQPFPAVEVAAIRARGAIPLVTLEPWPNAPGVACTTDVGTCLRAGTFDGVAQAWATAAADGGQRLLLRFAHEPNLRHYPWGLGKVAPIDYVEAWRHVHRLFTATGATNIEWVWAFQAPGGPNPDPSPWWPGLDVVDWVAIDGYNAGRALDWGGWLSFESLFARGLAATGRLAPRHPVLVTETASSTSGGSRVEWIRRMADLLATKESVCGLVWFEIDKEADWSVADDPPSAAALAGAFGQLRDARHDSSATVCG